MTNAPAPTDLQTLFVWLIVAMVSTVFVSLLGMMAVMLRQSKASENRMAGFMVERRKVHEDLTGVVTSLTVVSTKLEHAIASLVMHSTLEDIARRAIGDRLSRTLPARRALDQYIDERIEPVEPKGDQQP